MAQTLMAHSPGLARTIIMAPTRHFMHNPPWMAGMPLARTIFHGPMPVQAIEVLLYIHFLLCVFKYSGSDGQN